MHEGATPETVWWNPISVDSPQVLSKEQRWEFSMVLSGTETLFPYWKGGDAEWGHTVREQTALLTTAGVH